VQVIFDSTGRHIQTTNRQTQATHFYWRSATQLDSVRAPPAGSGGKTFILHYNGSSYLDSVRVGGRDVGISNVSGSLTRWKWPDGDSLKFHTGTNGKVDSVLDARSGATNLHYTSYGLVDTAKVWYDSASSHVASVTRFTPWQSAGYAGSAAADTSTAITTIDGPPIGNGFTTVFHIDKWGAPIAERDPYGSVTRYTRGNSLVPALVTEIDFPNSRKALMTYDTLGNILTLADTTWGANAFPTQHTRWTYHSANELFSPDSVRAPDNTLTRYAYTTLGLTDTMIDARGHVTKFGYAASVDSVRGQIVSVTERHVPTWIQSIKADRDTDLVTSVAYNSSGNSVLVKNPAGGATIYYRDAVGRVAGVTNPERYPLVYFYDSMDRDTLVVSNNVPDSAVAGCLSSEFVCSDAAIVNDLLTHPVSTRRQYTHGLLGEIDDYRGVAHRYSYDKRGLLIADIDEAGKADSNIYDRRGLLTQRKTRKGWTLTFSYDSLGRQTRWTMPTDTITMFGEYYESRADTVRRTYDIVGNLVADSNRHGNITRSYFENGAVHTEAIHGVTPDSLTSSLVADSVRMHYEAGGRLDSLIWRAGDTLHYTYKTTGDLDTLRISLANNAGGQKESYKFAWDSLGRRQQITYPFLSMTVASHYDRLGVLREMVSVNSGSRLPNRFNFTLTQDSVDAMGRPLHQHMACHDNFQDTMPADPCGDWLPSDAVTRYYRTGAIAAQTLTGRDFITTTDSFTYDPSGNRLRHSSQSSTLTVSTFSYPTASNRLASQIDSTSLGATTRYYFYNPDGSRREDYQLSGGIPVSSHKYQYDAAGRMVGAGASGYTAPNSCSYDPDGRMFQACGSTNVVLLGDNVVRDQSNGWFYVQAPGLDEPLVAVKRFNNVQSARLQFVSDGLGQLVAVADSQGTFNSLYEGPAPYAPGTWVTSGLTTRAQTFDPRRWTTDSGNLALSTFRTRQYDPATGSWLQEDHLGVAGGINLYQYNGNDPNSFSDPFGACPPQDDNYSNCEPGSADWYANRMAVGKGNAALNEIGGTFATCAESVACNVVLAVAAPVGNAVVRIGEAIEAAATSAGSSSLRMGSEAEARVAGRLWTGPGSTELTERTTGELIGRQSADASRIYRMPTLKRTGPNAGKVAANLVRLLANGKEAANVHLIVP
jgi:RHS repeat-associated protein